MHKAVLPFYILLFISTCVHLQRCSIFSLDLTSLEFDFHIISGLYKYWIQSSFISGADGYGIEISNQVDIRDKENFELAMRVSTKILSGKDFFTDLNGFQVKMDFFLSN